MYGESESNDRINLLGFNYNNKTYFYIKDEMGNIVSIVSDGIEVVRYIYDSYGNHQIYEVNQNGELILNNNLSFIGNINPIRYKSYYYDEETNLYYLNSRYYDSSIGRFISPDDISYLDSNIINGLNLYCYCNNNPVMYSDPEGTFKWKRTFGIIAEVLIDAVAIGAGIIVENVTGSRVLGFAVYSSIQNSVNSFYYSYISNGESDLDSSYYNIDDKGFRYLTRWERLDYTKKETQSVLYGLNEMRFFGEYTAHMWAWGLSKWAYGKDIPFFSYLAEHSREANISPDHGETGDNYWFNIFYILFGLLGA